MYINLNFLKFHSFKFNNKIHNLIHAKNDDYFDCLFYGDKNSLLEILMLTYKTNSFKELKNRFLRFHIINKDKKDLIEKVIKRCHNNLWLDLEQIFEYKNSIDYYQVKISKKERLIFVESKNQNNKSVFIPILLDLNHCFYLNNNKSYDNNYKKKNLNHWDYKKTQEEIKNKLIKKFKNK